MSRKKKIISAALVIGLIAIGFGVSPLLRNKTLNQPLPSPPSTNEPMLSTQPQILDEAMFVARAHDVKGKAVLVQIGDQKVIRFEDFKTINGPDLRIYLSAGLDNKDYIDLGAIKATEGNINYPLPANTDTAKYNKVLIWCRSFNVLFSYAEL